MKTAGFVAVWAILLLAGEASARDAEVRTEPGAILCLRPFELRQALAAVKAGNTAWLKELACVQLAGGIRTILIDPNAPLAQPWQVRIFPPTGKPEGVTAWGLASSFTTIAGKPFWPPHY